MARKCDVALVIQSGKFTLSELSARLERNSEPGSHEKGGLRPHGMPWERTVWRANASDNDAPLRAQCLQLVRDMPPKCAELMAAEPDDVSVWMDIALFFDTAYVTLTLGRDVISELAAKGIGLEITAYPSAAEGQDNML